MYPDPKSSSQKLYDRALSSLPGGNTRTTVFMKPYPIYAARGEGCRVFDVDGNSYIDCINNFTSLIHGHAHPVLIEAATRQLALGSAFGMPTESEVDLAELIASRLPWPVKLAGETRRPDGEEISFEGVTLLGRRSSEQIREDYRRARIYALPARYEPFGLSVLEAASAGCALVLGDIKSLRELWKGAALFVPPDDPEALRRTIAGLIWDEPRRNALARAARERARTFTATRMTDAYLEAYTELSRNDAPATARCPAAAPVAEPAFA